MSLDQKKVYEKLNQIVTDKSMTRLKIENGSNVLIGKADENMQTIDIGDILTVGEGSYTNSIGLLMHETWEGYQIQTKNAPFNAAHIRALRLENDLYNLRSGYRTGEHYINTDMHLLDIEIFKQMEKAFVPIGNAYIYFNEKNNVTNIFRP